MEKLYPIMTKAVELGATDIHLAFGQLPVYRVSRRLMFDDTKTPMTKDDLENILESFFEIINGLKVK